MKQPIVFCKNLAAHQAAANRIGLALSHKRTDAPGQALNTTGTEIVGLAFQASPVDDQPIRHRHSLAHLADILMFKEHTAQPTWQY